MPQNIDNKVVKAAINLTAFEKKYGLAALAARTTDDGLKKGFSVETVELGVGPSVRQVGLVKIIFLDFFIGDHKATIIKYRSSEIALALTVAQAMLGLKSSVVPRPDNWQLFINENQIAPALAASDCKSLNFQIFLVNHTKSAPDAVNEICIVYTATVTGLLAFIHRKKLLIYLQTPEFADKQKLTEEKARWHAVEKGLESELSEDL